MCDAVQCTLYYTLVIRMVDIMMISRTPAVMVLHYRRTIVSESVPTHHRNNNYIPDTRGVSGGFENLTQKLKLHLNNICHVYYVYGIIV